MDRVSKSLSNERACKPLKGLVGDDRVSDIIYKMGSLIEQCETVSLVMAGSNWAVMASPKKDPKRDAPLEESGAKKFTLLVKEREKLGKHLKDRSMIDSEARRGPAADHYLPPFMTKMAIELLLDYAAFSCAFDRLVWAQYQQNQLTIQNFIESLERFLSVCPEKHSVLDTYNLLVHVRDRMAKAVQTAIDKGNDQSKLMSKAQKHALDSHSGQMLAEQLAEAIRQTGQHSQRGSTEKKGKGKQPMRHEDEALGAFSHNPNPSQESAATAAAESQRAKKRVKLEQISGSKSDRARTIKGTICKFYWKPEGDCTRDNCRFAHVGQAETRAMGISDEEIAEALV